MLVSELIERIYKEVPDSSYIIRFLDYLVYSSNIRVTFIIKEYSAEPLISGILQNVKTKERYSMSLKLWTSEPASEKIWPEYQGVEKTTKERNAWSIKED